MQYQINKNHKISKEIKTSTYQPKNSINLNNPLEILVPARNSDNTINIVNPLNKSKDSNSFIHNSSQNLFAAVEYNDLEKVEQILKNDSSQINELNDEGISPLHISVIKSNLKMIDLLLRYGADSNIMSEKEKQTPLHFAYLNQNSMTEEILQELKNYNASDNVYDINNKKPSDYMNNSKSISGKKNNNYNYNNTEDYNISADKRQINSNTNTIMVITNENHFDSFMTTNKEDDNKSNVNTNTVQTPSKLKEEGINTNEYDENNEPNITINSNNKYNSNNTINSKSDSINRRQYTFGKEEDYHKFQIKNIKNNLDINTLSNENSIKDLDINYYNINKNDQNGKESQEFFEQAIQSEKMKENNQSLSSNKMEIKYLEDENEDKNELNDSLEDLNIENYNINNNNTIDRNNNKYLYNVNSLNENSNSNKSSDNIINVDSFTRNNGRISNSILTYTDSININGSSQNSRKISPKGTITTNLISNFKDNMDKIELKLPNRTYNNNTMVLNNENISNNIINNNKNMSDEIINEENNLNSNQNTNLNNLNIDNFYKKIILKKRDSIIKSHRNCYSNVSKYELKNINLSLLSRNNNNNTINSNNNYKNNSFISQNSIKNTDNTYVNKTIIHNTSKDYNSSYRNNTVIHNNNINGICEENLNSNSSYYKSKENSDNKISLFTTKSQSKKIKPNGLIVDDINTNNIQNNCNKNGINNNSFIINNNNDISKNKNISEFKYVDNIVNSNYMNNSNDNSNININEIMNEDSNNSKNILSALKYWLSNIDLINYYPNFINNSIFDISNLIESMKSYQTKLKFENIESNLKIRKPGHIYRILCRLEVDANLIDNKVTKFLLKNDKIFNKDEYYLNGGLEKNNNNLNLLISQDYQCLGCCKTNKTFSNMAKNDLKSFLKRYGLMNYYQNFYHNGFELIEYVMLQMYGGYPINDDILENCFHVYDEEQRKTILKAIVCEMKKINQFLVSEEYNNYQNIDLVKYENIVFSGSNENNEETKIVINNEKNANCNIF